MMQDARGSNRSRLDACSTPWISSQKQPFGKIEAEGQIVTHYQVDDQRPNDVDLLIPSVVIHQQQFGRPPRLVTADAAFFSSRNEAQAHERGVKRVAIPNRSTKSAERKRLQKKRWFKDAQK